LIPTTSQTNGEDGAAGENGGSDYDPCGPWAGTPGAGGIGGFVEGNLTAVFDSTHQVTIVVPPGGSVTVTW
jgi:hypothetical protein